MISDVITSEIDMGVQLLEYSSLSDPVVWVEKIKQMATRNVSRQLATTFLTDKGYDIKQTSHWLQDFYLQLR
ncbi:hypothetical protein D3C85_1856720 [compost metagenome]